VSFPGASTDDGQRARRFRPLPRLLGLLLGLFGVVGGLWFLFGRPREPVDAHDALRVMTYSSFMSAWGPGPEIAKRFRKETGVAVEFQDAGDAGLILEKLKLFPVDAVVGLDRFSLAQARERIQWREIPSLRKEAGSIGKSPSLSFADESFQEASFIAIDWAPLAFVYRQGEVIEPTRMQDLLDPRFKGAIALEDPRTSTPGLQFLLWVLQIYGEDGGFKFLESLKPNLHSVSPSWSTAYGAFTKKQAKLALSYMTSPIYHLTEEKDDSYRAASFSDGNPVQVEYAGIPSRCARCSDAETFIRFLLKPEIQALIMKKNFMIPVVGSATEGTPFKELRELQSLKRLELTRAPEFLKRRDDLFEKWRKLGL
jgi:thiamine transport system substrate-binding protein